MKWKSARVGSKFKSKIPTVIRLSCSSLLTIEEFEQEWNVPIRKLIRFGEWRKSMKRTFVLILAALAAAALFGGLVHAVLVAAQVSEPATTTVYGVTPRRLWATTVALLALVGVVIGGLALARPASRFGTATLVAGLLSVVNGGLVLAIANGGPGSGNGVVGGAAALVLGLVAMALGGLALARRRIALGPGA
jgi:Family of unknown function (DUF6223)